ncbi:acyltransferase [Rhizobium sp. 1399]|uniref:acyltransferase n=1 Tax=Rhizobium sp. 1399 TaxID=2817758 RepID=UPI00285DBBDF|nr:acyltransferase [Rhizobium sp. 1399]MDR6671380.1 acetyltransferase-like isoleucine patch superfamily enzyme [Rhizobium sp. 1399]
MKRHLIKALTALRIHRAVAYLQRVYFGVGSVGTFTRISLKTTFRGNRRNIHIGAHCVFEQGVVLECSDAASSIHIGSYSILGIGAVMQTGRGGTIHCGSHLSANPYTVIYGHGGTKIGNYVRIAAHCVIIPANHIFSDPESPITLQGLSLQGITIGDDVWLGTGVRVLDGTTIGDGCVVGAGSVVTKDLPPYSISVGVPAKVKKERRGGNS